MNRITWAALIFAGVTLSAGPAAAQTRMPITLPQPGEQVRVTVDSSDAVAGYAAAPLRWRQGAFDSIGGTHLWMSRRDAQLSVPLDMVKTLQVRRERRSATSVLAYGTLVGAALGSVAVLLSPYRDWDEGAKRSIVPFAALGFGVSVALLPTMTEGWRSIPMGIAATPH